MSYKMIFTEIVQSSQFSRMSRDAQLIYFYLLTCTDGIGVIDNTDFLSRMYDRFDDNMQELINNGYVYRYDDYRYIIMDWPIHNKLDKAPYIIKKTIHEDISDILIIEPKKRYIFKEDSECNNMTTSNTVNDDKINPEKDEDYEQKCNLLREHDIVTESKRGKDILNKCSLLEIKRGIDYALNHMPVKLNNKAGFIINCILNKCIDKKVCPVCKGKQKIEVIEPKYMPGDWGKAVTVLSECHNCKGTGYIIKDFEE